jgi:hypothetical protein
MIALPIDTARELYDIVLLAELQAAEMLRTTPDPATANLRDRLNWAESILDVAIINSESAAIKADLDEFNSRSETPAKP